MTTEGVSMPSSPDAREPGEPRMRHDRRRFVVWGMASLGAVLGLTALFRRLGARPGGDGSGALDLFSDFPVRSVEDVPDAAPDDWVVTVDGLVERSLRLDRAAWDGLTRFEQTVDFHCVEGWSVPDVEWGGVRPAVLLEQAGLRPEATHVIFHAHGGEYVDSLPMDLVRHPQTVLADTLEGAPLPPDHGGPLRLVVPVQLGYKSVKWVTRLEVTDRAVRGYWEERGYPMDAPVRG
jgi:DMSO/TMAO reductase YedYZ molybdopterin-dependent catalytic subunit